MIKKMARAGLGHDLYQTVRERYYQVKHLHRALPDFLIVGTQKGGTSSLYAYLAAHPQVMPPRRGAAVDDDHPKELHFFDYNYSNGVAWYRAHFPPRAALQLRGAITGEASPYYLYHPHAPRRIAEVVPQAKLIVLLRNPVDRAISHYWHEVKLGEETRPLGEALDPAVEQERLRREKERVQRDPTYFSHVHMHHAYLDRGKYVEQLQRYHAFFDREQMLVMPSETLFTRTQATLDTVTNFLGLPSRTLEHVRARNTGSYADTPDSLKKELGEFFQPYNERLYGYLDLDKPWW
jgi:hypothetical protein